MSAIVPTSDLTPLLNPQLGRSPAVVAAYLMYSRQLDTEGALQLIRESRPDVEYVRSTGSGTYRNPITSVW